MHDHKANLFWRISTILVSAIVFAGCTIHSESLVHTDQILNSQANPQSKLDSDAFSMRSIDTEYEVRETPWQEVVVPVPSEVKELRVSVRRCNPVVAEYEYKVSFRLVDGKSSTLRLADQTAGQAMMIIDFFPQEGSPGYARFCIADSQFAQPQYVSLSTGQFEVPSMDTRAIPVGFISNHLTFCQATNWNKQHATAEVALHDGRLTEALSAAKAEVAEARILGDKKLIASSLSDLASALQISKTGSAEQIEELLLEALKNGTEPDSVRDYIIRGAKWQILFRLASFYQDQGKFDDARACIEKSIEIVVGYSELPDRTSLLRTLKLELVRIALLKKNVFSAFMLIYENHLSSDQDDLQKRFQWREFYPHILILENDVRECLRSDPANNNFSASGRFSLKPSGEVSDIEICSTKGARGFGKVFTELALYAAGSQGLPLHSNGTLHCAIDLTFGRDGSSVSIKPR